MMLVKMHVLEEVSQPSCLSPKCEKKGMENIVTLLKGITFLFIDSLEEEIIRVKQ